MDWRGPRGELAEQGAERPAGAAGAAGSPLLFFALGRLAAVDISLGADSARRRGVAAGAGRGAASYGVKVRNSPIATISL